MGKKRDWIVLACVFAAAGLALLASRFAPVGAGIGAPKLDLSGVTFTDDAPKSYLVVSVNGVEYERVPLTGEGEIVIRGGNGEENVLAVRVDGVRMARASCQNQDCVHQGEVTLENRARRALYDAVVCLPNKLSARLVSAEDK